jgi:hypothetical protein
VIQGHTLERIYENKVTGCGGFVAIDRQQQAIVFSAKKPIKQQSMMEGIMNRSPVMGSVHFSPFGNDNELKDFSLPYQVKVNSGSLHCYSSIRHQLIPVVAQLARYQDHWLKWLQWI